MSEHGEVSLCHLVLPGHHQLLKIVLDLSKHDIPDLSVSGPVRKQSRSEPLALCNGEFGASELAPVRA